MDTSDTVGTWCMVALICTCLAIVFVWNYKLKKPRFVKIIWIMISIAAVLTAISRAFKNAAYKDGQTK